MSKTDHDPVEVAKYPDYFAINDFAAWLTTRPGTLEIGASHECSVVVDLIKEYCAIANIKLP